MNHAAPGRTEAAIIDPNGRNLKVIILGKIMSGNLQFSQQLARSYGIQVIDSKKIIDDLQNKRCKIEGDLVEVTQRLEMEMLEKGVLEDSLMIDIIMCYIRKVESENSGWVLVDFPRTITQARLLEKSLSGYVSHRLRKMINYLKILPHYPRYLGTYSVQDQLFYNIVALSGYFYNDIWYQLFNNIVAVTKNLNLLNRVI